MKVTALSLKSHFKRHAKYYIVGSATVLGALFGAAASELFEYGQTTANALIGGTGGFFFGSLAAMVSSAEGGNNNDMHLS